MKRDRRARVSFEDPDDENDEDDVVRHAPGSTAALVADVLAAEGAHKKRDESKADENAARATVLPSGRDSDDEEDEDARDRTVPRANDADELARRAVGAAETRALLRSEMAAGVRARDDVETRASVEDAEEGREATGKENDGFMAFNLDEERRDGYFDDDGNYVEYAEEKDEADLWLDEDAEVDERFASGAIRRSTAALEEEEDAKAMSEGEVAVMQREIAGYLNPGETVLGALKRLGGGAKPGGGRAGKNKGKPTKTMSEGEKRAFDKLTELSSALMGQGEYEVYTFRKEAFERAARLYAPTPSVVEDANDGQDMFADTDDEAEEPAPAAKKVKTTRAPKRDEAPTKSTALDFSAMSVKALKAYIVAHGGAVDGHIAEKSELVSLARSRPRVIVPEGYVWSVERSMYYSEASDLCYEPAKNLFTDGADTWWTYDEQRGFVEWRG